MAGPDASTPDTPGEDSAPVEGVVGETTTDGSPHDGGPTQHTPQPTQEDSWGLVVRDVVMSILAVALVGGYLFAISGVFPPMVAVESESMTPNMEVNDLVFVMDADRFPPALAHGDTGVVTAESGTEASYQQFGENGDVIIFAPGGDEHRTPVIHRAMLWVEEGENWCDRADGEYISNADHCDEAPHSGFITKGDNNPRYDQGGAGQLSEPVKPEWVIGTAEVRVPHLGYLRLRLQ